ncbi:MAG TPA: RsmG family class I SAM-dependent methyltransferase [Thermoanaerobaculia bacterium]|nr:RsmG family class I SAM-dependent methyltransferase [Thermoanaerobaculia bacterium]
MANLPALSAATFAERLAPHSPEPLAAPTLAALHAHYEELRLWAPRLALIGPGTADEVLERHFGESLAALPLLPLHPAGDGELVDVGSGAGFPGLVLAAARPGWRVTLVEARERKWAFLMSAARKMSAAALAAGGGALSCRCLNARVGDPLPEGVPASIEAISARAVRLPATDFGRLLERLGPADRALVWAGEADPDLPAGWAAETAARLPGSDRRRIVVVRRAAP